MSDHSDQNDQSDHESSPTTKPILVLGGNGKTGRRVAERLTARGLPVRIGSRAATPAFDWEDPSGWDAVLDGVGAVYISFQPDLAVPGSDAAIAELARRAVDHGVERLVLLSGRGEPEAERCEKIVAEAAGTSARWTVVRASWFMQNFSENFFVDSLLAGEVVVPLGPVPEPFVDVDDIADVAVAALTEPGHDGQVYEVTGPRMLSFADAVGEIAGAAGRDIAYVQVTMDEFTAALRAEQVPDEVVDLLVYLFRVVLDGRNAHLADGVERALGRPPRDFAAYAEAAAATGVWAP
jgi:uncharacterized protein YbjT (DUF2867 family)